ncbi:hypothetical protein GYMLUDRAFT_42063 [Collybiopsis luxurians FD-317 M1]|uniref:Uncharacterized protein n=1 Tax=Collybiopsis luxurians FD-317 M1 TaxID=944289 RepID=A0A0D0CIU1_9AGAR|nr:hypothetical protein GYMLUDRAFT_42063 [Collybiopsis luxurians FD-317 M1]
MFGTGTNPGIFPNARNFQMINPVFENVNGNQNIHYYGPSVHYYVKGPLRRFVQDLRDYFIVCACQEGSAQERVVVVRKFDQEEDRDLFESCLQKSSWNPFSIQPLWKVNIHGRPCLAVSSAREASLLTYRFPWISGCYQCKLSTRYKKCSMEEFLLREYKKMW